MCKGVQGAPLLKKPLWSHPCRQFRLHRCVPGGFLTIAVRICAGKVICIDATRDAPQKTIFGTVCGGGIFCRRFGAVPSAEAWV